MKNRLFLLTLAYSVSLGLFLPGCTSTGPRQVSSDGDGRTATMYAVARDLDQWAWELTQRALQDGFLEKAEYTPHPVNMIVLDVENDTDLPRIDTLKSAIKDRITAAFRQSGKIQLVSQFDSHFNDMMKAIQYREALRAGRPISSLNMPNLSLEEPTLYTRTFIRLIPEIGAGQERRYHYYLYMEMSDLRNGTIAWNDESDRVTVYSRRGSLGF